MSGWLPSGFDSVDHVLRRAMDGGGRSVAAMEEALAEIDRLREEALAEIDRLRDVTQSAVDTLHDHGALKRIEGARAMQEKAKHAVMVVASPADWTANIKVGEAIEAISELKPEDV